MGDIFDGGYDPWADDAGGGIATAAPDGIDTPQPAGDGGGIVGDGRVPDVTSNVDPATGNGAPTGTGQGSSGAATATSGGNLSDYLKLVMSGITAVGGTAAQIAGTVLKNNATSQAAQDAINGGRAGAAILTDAYGRAATAQNTALDAIDRNAGAGLSAVAPLYGGLAQGYADARNTSAGQFGNVLQGIAADAAGILQPAAAQAAQSYGTAGSNYGGALSQAAALGGSSLRADAGSYADSLDSNARNLASGLSGTARQFGADVTGDADRYSGRLNQLAADAYGGYAQGGQQALAQLRGVAAQDPSQMTPAQLQARDDYLRNAQAANAASGLRGAGQAGAAAIDKGLANLAAQSFAQNQARGDAATTALLNSGMGATGQIYGAGATGQGAILNAGNQAASSQLQADQAGLNSIFAAGNQGAQASLAAGQAAAQLGINATNAGAQAGLNQSNLATGNSTATANNLAGIGLSTGSQAANAALAAGTANAGVAQQAGQGIINGVQGYYGQLGTDAAARGQVATDAILNPANAQASAEQGAGAINAATAVGQANNWGSLLGSIGGAINANSKAATVNPLNAIAPSAA